MSRAHTKKISTVSEDHQIETERHAKEKMIAEEVDETDKPSSNSSKNTKEKFEDMVNLFWKNNPFNLHNPVFNELEIRFGSLNKDHPITKIDYDNVISKLKSLGFSTKNTDGSYMLRIQTELIDPSTGKPSRSSIRTEIDGLIGIQQYCKTNNIKTLLEGNSVKFNRKNAYRTKESFLRPVDFTDFNFRVSYQQEEELKQTNQAVKSLIDGWEENTKYMRFLNRVTFTHPDLPIKADFSVVKTGNDCNILKNIESYEIELEINNEELGPFKKTNTSAALLQQIRTAIKYILMGLQGTNYPISLVEQHAVLTSYMKLIYGPKYHVGKVLPKNFIGPSSFTLQMVNISKKNESSVVPNIRENYTVTDKADGSRALLFIPDNGKIYLITTSMTVVFTGAIIDNREVFNTLIDGELIYHNRIGEFINLYAAFDIYYINEKDVRSYGFIEDKDKDKDKDKSKKEIYRLDVLKNSMKLIASSVKSIVPHKPSPIKLTSKKFYANSGEESIFDNCMKILQQDEQGLFEYNTDGIIFTPANMGVGLNKIGGVCSNTKTTWEHSFKWKAPQFNTIDFLVTTEKTVSGEDAVMTVFQDGVNTGSATQLLEYKTIVLRVGYDTKKHGLLNPCQDILDDKIPTKSSEKDIDNEDTYSPQRFYPSSPYDENAGLANIPLKKDASGNNQMYTEGGEMFESHTIVECKYVHENAVGWKWVPIKVRYDKTSEYRNKAKNYGNAYHVANSNWKTIHNPITVSMITTGQDIPDEILDDNVYYNNITSDSTKAMRDFHNLFVKKVLIVGTSKRDGILIDFSVGKAGDFPKWIEAGLSFVFGVDLSGDNIENKFNGACVRYFNYLKDFKRVPKVLFVNGNSALNIKSGEAMLNDKAILVTRAVFGVGINDPKRLGAGVAAQYGKGQNGFDVSSCQFSMHYFFKDETTFKNFITNVAECTKVGGYFISTCYDGKLVFDALSSQENITINDEKGNKIWEIQKLYSSADKFEDNISSLGFPINVYQESIGKTIQEYLVNFTYLDRIMENYGFKLISQQEAAEMHVPSGSATFNELYSQLTNELTSYKGMFNKYGKALHMTPSEKYISFLNRFVIYKKITKVNVSDVSIELFQDANLDKRQSISSASSYSSYVKQESLEKLPNVIKMDETIILTPVQESSLEIGPEPDPIVVKTKIIRKAKVSKVEKSEKSEEVEPKKKTTRKSTKVKVEEDEGEGEKVEEVKEVKVKKIRKSKKEE
jgi:hypothetical protein